jgi:hypothetical protein
MKKLMFLAAMLIACGGKKDDAKPAAADIATDDDYMKKATAGIEQATSSLKADGQDCDKVGDDMAKLVSDPTNIAIEAYEKAHPDAKKKWEDATQDQKKAFEAVAIPAFKACKDNKKLQDAMAEVKARKK